MKILIVASYNKKRFAPFVVEQARALQQAGCEIEWFGIQGKGCFGYLKEITRLREKMRECQPDIVHAHYGLSCLLANLATRRVPVVSTYHGSDINLAKVRPLSKIAIWLSAWNIFVSMRNMELVGAKNKKRCSLIPCGINLPEPWSELQKRQVDGENVEQWVRSVLSSEKKHVLFAGAFDNAVKNSELAKQVIHKLNENGVNAELIELKGYNREQVTALMYSCDAFLMTSKTEGSPQVIKEAVACGCPIVSVDVGDVKERVEGLEGCYVAQSREPEELAFLLEKAINYGKTKGHQHIIDMQLDNEQVAKRIVEIYKKILNV